MQNIYNFIKNENLKKNLFSILYTCMQRALSNEEKNTKRKKDGTFITKADKEIHEIIKNSLINFYPSIPVISEEGEFRKENFLEELYWLIDPIDGTSSYVKGFSSYTINIALIYKGSPILGIIGNPPTNSIWYGNGNTGIKVKNHIQLRLKTNKTIRKKVKIILSQNSDLITKNFVDQIHNNSVEYCSSSLKFCILAEGKADLYPRLNSISKWDIAAGDAILRSAGGVVLNAKGKEYLYNTNEVETGEFYAIATKQVWSHIEKIKSNVR